MANKIATYWDLDGLYNGVLKPVTVKEDGVPGRKVPKGRLTIFDADSGKKLYFPPSIIALFLFL